MSAMADMSRAIRLEIERYGGFTLSEIPTDVLEQYVTIIGAFALDLEEELSCRNKEVA